MSIEQTSKNSGQGSQNPSNTGAAQQPSIGSEQLSANGSTPPSAPKTSPNAVNLPLTFSQLIELAAASQSAPSLSDSDEELAKYLRPDINSDDMIEEAIRWDININPEDADEELRNWFLNHPTDGALDNVAVEVTDGSGSYRPFAKA